MNLCPSATHIIVPYISLRSFVSCVHLYVAVMAVITWSVHLQVVGSQVLVKIVKNKHAPPFKTAQFELEFGKGISRDSEIIELGCKHKYITKAGGAFYHMNGQSFRGRDAIKRYFAENEGAREELMLKLREKLVHHGTEKKDPDAETPETPDAGESEEIVTAETTDEEVGAAVEA